MVNRKCEKRDKRCFLGFCFFSKREKSVHRKLFRNVNNNNSNNDNGNNSESDEEKSVSGTHLLVEQLWLQYEFNTYLKNRMNSSNNKKSSRATTKRTWKKKGKKIWADNKTNNKETVMLFERALCGIKLRIHLQILVLLFACLPTRSLFLHSFHLRSALRPSSSLCSSTGFADRSHSFSHVVHCVCPMSRKNFHFQF